MFCARPQGPGPAHPARRWRQGRGRGAAGALGLRAGCRRHGRDPGRGSPPSSVTSSPSISASRAARGWRPSSASCWPSPGPSACWPAPPGSRPPSCPATRRWGPWPPRPCRRSTPSCCTSRGRPRPRRLVLAVVIYARHKENIQRLLTGKETKIGSSPPAARPRASARPNAATGCGWPAPRASAPSPSATLLARYGSATKALAALPGRSPPLKVPSPAEAEAEIAAGEALGARLMLLGDPDFPPLLAAIDPPPPLIWTLGDVALLHRPAVALVGASHSLRRRPEVRPQPGRRSRRGRLSSWSRPGARDRRRGARGRR